MQDPTPTPPETRIPRRILVEAHVATDCGLRRDGNEDAVAMCDLGGTSEGPRMLLAVADGMGGAAAGEVASRLAIDTLQAVVVSPLCDEMLATALPSALSLADERIRWQAGSDPSMTGMGTTCTAALLVGKRLVIAHTGDSRAYLLRGGTLYLLTTDHTMVELLLRSRAIAPWQAQRHPQRHYLSSALGVGSDTRIDHIDVALRRGDVLLLCTDGLHGIVSDYAIRRVLTTEIDPERACERLLQIANDSGAPDNVSCAIARIDGGGLPSARSPGSEIEGATIVSSDHEDEPTATHSRPKLKLH